MRGVFFEKLSLKLQKVYDKLGANSCKVDNGDIVDNLWTRIQNLDIQVYISSLKVDYHHNKQDYKLILQDIAAEIAAKPQVTLSSSTRNVSATYTRQGLAPASGAFTDDGTLFIGSYSNKQW